LSTKFPLEQKTLSRLRVRRLYRESRRTPPYGRSVVEPCQHRIPRMIATRGIEDRLQTVTASLQRPRGVPLYGNEALVCGSEPADIAPGAVTDSPVLRRTVTRHDEVCNFFQAG